MPNTVSLSLVIHSHQPVGNFDHVIEEAFQKSYQPFLSILARHPRIRLNLHFSGILFRWIELRHPEFIRQLRELTERGQVEHVGGGYYEPILAAIPDAEKITQLSRQAEFLYSRFGTTPRGAWVAERVWEQGLILPLAEAGVEYTILDDSHFAAAGLEPGELHEPYLTEESGTPLILIPSLQSLRYTIPFREPEETLSILRSGLALKHGLFAVGDDCEKFGVWPGTYEHCYVTGWLERFFSALEAAADWLEVTTLSKYLETHQATRRVYPPTASYAEMMMWALPPGAAADLEDCVAETVRMEHGEHFHRFLRGGQWRNFLAKYPESNQTHKLMLRACRRWHELRRVALAVAPECRALDEAQDHLLAAQCNDAYWHGIFGGLYAPHLRSALLGRLIEAEKVMDKVGGADGGCRKMQCAVEDFDVDGYEEVLLDHPCFGAVIRPGDGGTVSSLRFKAAGVELINSLARRPEAYHRRVKENVEQAQGSGQPASIHDVMRSKEANLGSMLRYDHHARHCFRAYLFSPLKTWEDFDRLGLNECAELAGGAWDLAEVAGRSGALRLLRNAVLRLDGREQSVRAAKSFTVEAEDSGGFSVACTLALNGLDAELTRVGIEAVFNLLAPNSPDRYFQSAAKRYPLEFQGELPGATLTLIDEWRRVEIVLDAPGATSWWITPVETISQSEAGFERIYQGSTIMAVWQAGLTAGSEVHFRLQAGVSSGQ